MKPTKTLVVAVLVVTAIVGFVPLPALTTTLVVIFFVVVLLDLSTLFRRTSIQVQRNVSHSLALKQDSWVRLLVTQTGNFRQKITVSDRCPLELNPEGLPSTGYLSRDLALEVQYAIRPTERGDLVFEFVDIAADSLLGFWQRIIHISCRSSVRVFPDFSQIKKYLQLLLAQQTNQIGIKKQIRRGEGQEFLQLREYRQGDPLNRIDWKATAKRRDIISREFEDERSQQILFLVDTGRKMHSHDGEVTLFDRTLDAMVLLSYIALRQGDRIALQCFGQDRRWISSLSGLTSINVLLNQIYDLQTGPIASDYIAAAEQALARQRKRSLVVLLTSLRDEDENVIAALRLLTTRHSVLLGSLRESSLDATMTSEIKNIDHALAVLGAAQYLDERNKVIQRCRSSCHVVVESLPQNFHARIVNAYWQVKRSGQL